MLSKIEDLSKICIFFPDRSFLVANSREGQCHIIYCSDGFCRLTGYSRAEVMQRPASCEFLCGPLTSQQAVTSLREALQDGVEKHAEILYYRKDGIYKWKIKKYLEKISLTSFSFPQDINLFENNPTATSKYAQLDKNMQKNISKNLTQLKQLKITSV